jgi:hypothetical protein
MRSQMFFLPVAGSVQLSSEYCYNMVDSKVERSSTVREMDDGVAERPMS